MNNQAKRFRNATIFGTVVSAILATLVPLVLFGGQYFTSNTFNSLIMPFCFGVGTFLSIHFFWRRLLQKKETRKRALWLGVATGAIALFVSCTLVMWSTFGTALLSPTQPLFAGGNSIFGILGMLFLMPFVASFMAFVFGGFLVLPLGALLGWFFSRDSHSEKSAVFK